eukprot:scaffold808_cov194-Pinguiococcus_pyrenoidosus.AAC.6
MDIHACSCGSTFALLGLGNFAILQRIGPECVLPLGLPDRGGRETHVSVAGWKGSPPGFGIAGVKAACLPLILHGAHARAERGHELGLGFEVQVTGGHEVVHPLP